MPSSCSCLAPHRHHPNKRQPSSAARNKARASQQQTQGVLLSHVAGAIKEGGPSHAVAFCNHKVYQLVDSLSKAYFCKISRISAQNRNPDNGLSTKQDSIAWTQTRGMRDSAHTEDKLITELFFYDKRPWTYYRSISIAMPTCLKCHGIPNEDIAPGTLAVIDSLYPRDRARNYHMGDLRGLWKVEFFENE